MENPDFKPKIRSLQCFYVLKMVPWGPGEVWRGPVILVKKYFHFWAKIWLFWPFLARIPRETRIRLLSLGLLVFEITRARRRVTPIVAPRWFPGIDIELPRKYECDLACLLECFSGLKMVPWGLGVILFKNIIFAFFGPKSRILGHKMAKIHGKSQFRGLNSAYWSVFPA